MLRRGDTVSPLIGRLQGILIVHHQANHAGESGRGMRSPDVMNRPMKIASGALVPRVVSTKVRWPSECHRRLIVATKRSCRSELRLINDNRQCSLFRNSAQHGLSATVGNNARWSCAWPTAVRRVLAPLVIQTGASGLGAGGRRCPRCSTRRKFWPRRVLWAPYG